MKKDTILRNSGDLAFERNKAWADTSGDYQTKLEPKEEVEFRGWVKEEGIPFDDDPKADYDMRGFWKAMKAGEPVAQTEINQHDKRRHFPDVWKTPYHPSFSAGSKWAKDGAPDWTENDQLVTPDGTVIHDERMPLRRRDLFSGEDKYFKANPDVTGMPAKDGRVILNPYSNLTPEQETAAYRNEDTRLFMRKNGTPQFSLTPEQEDFLKTTTYANASSEDKRATVLARIITGDPSAGVPTEEQRKAAEGVAREMGQ